MRVVRMAVAPSLAASLVGPALARAQQQQAVVLTGTVQSKTQAAVPGAVVSIPALKLTAVTNDAGNYRLTIPNPPADRQVQVVISSIGYRTVEGSVLLSGQVSRHDVRMEEEAIALDEVVITGTAGRQERRAQAATVSSIDATKIAQTAPVQSVAQMLQGRTPGVILRQGSGSAGTAQTIRIRGQASISLDNEPIVFIDGIRADSRDRQIYGVGNQQGSRLNDLRLDEIESIEIVKGPAAATLYGANASSGVIQIITKRGRAQGGFTQSVNLEYGYTEPNFEAPANWAVCSATDVTNQSRTLCYGQPAGTLISDNPLERVGAFENGQIRNFDWNLRGGGESYGVFFAFGRDEEIGTLPNNEYEKMSGMLNFDWYTSSKVRIDAGVRIGRTRTQLPHNDNNIYGYLGGGMLGNPRTVGMAQDGWYGSNRTTEAISALETVDASMRYQPRLAVNYTPWTWFTNRFTLGADMTRTEAYQFWPKNQTQWFDTNELNSGQIGEARENRDQFTIDYLGNINMQATQDLRMDVSFGTQIIATNTSLTNATGIGLVSNVVRNINSSARQTGGGSQGKSREVGFLGQVQFSYKDKIYPTVSGRIDQHSSFGRDADAFFSPRVGVSYVISDEGFWQTSFLQSIVNTLQVRGAWGTTGKSPNSGARAYYAANPFALTSTQSENGVTWGNPGNSSLKPERSTEIELGFDAGLLNDRLGLQVVYFHKKTKDAILERPLPGSLGFSQDPFANIGGILNKGFEVDLNARILTGEKFTWEGRVGFNTLHNQVLDMGDVAPIGAGTPTRTVKGYPIGGQWGYDVVGYDLTNGVAILSDTMVFLGNGANLPGYSYQVSSTFNILRNISVYVGLDGVGDVIQYNNTDQFRERQNGTGELFVRRDELLTPEERLAYFGPWRTESGTSVGRANADFMYREDASFLKLREVSLTYRFPRAISERFLRSSSSSLTLSSRNINTWTEFRGFDPETQQFLTAPVDRKFSARLNVQF